MGNETPNARAVNWNGSVRDIPEHELISRAVRNARAPDRWPHSRQVAVMHAFGLGSSYARELCQRVGVDPDENVRR